MGATLKQKKWITDTLKVSQENWVKKGLEKILVPLSVTWPQIIVGEIRPH